MVMSFAAMRSVRLWPRRRYNEMLDEELHHALRIDSRMTLVRPELKVKAFARALKRLNELHHVRRMDVVVRCPKVEHQMPAQAVGIRHCRTLVIARLIFLRKPHVALGVDRVVVAP